MERIDPYNVDLLIGSIEKFMEILSTFVLRES